MRKNMEGPDVPATVGGEIRRVQRLGSSSLVVTLPKSWVRSLNLKPGDPVYVVVEGRSVRVMPVENEGVGSAAFRVQGLEEGEARRFLWCAYVLGPDEILVEAVGEGVYEALREASLSLVGVEVSREDRGAKINVLVDPSKLDPRSSIRAVAGDLEEIVKSLVRVLKGEAGMDEVSRLRRSLTRSLALVERSLMVALTSQPSPQSPATVNTLIAANFLGLAASTFAEAAELAAKSGVRDEEASRMLEQVSRIAMETALNVASPSLKRSKELINSVSKAREAVMSTALSDSTPKSVAIVLTIAAEALKHLYVATTLSYCSARILSARS